MPPAPVAARLLKRIQDLYDEMSPAFLRAAGDTFQAGLLVVGGREQARASNLALAARAGIRSGMRVLDAGCGVGGPSIHIASRLRGVRIDGITLSRVQAQLAARLVARAGLTNRVRVIQGDYHCLPFADRSFDVVYFFECTGYSYDRRRLFVEVGRVLRPGGTVYIKDVFREARALSPPEQAEQRAFDRMWALHESPTIPATTAALRKAGFRIRSAQRFSDMSGSHFVSSMFDHTKEGPALNDFGRRFFRRMSNLPTFFGEVIAVKATRSTRGRSPRRPRIPGQDGSVLDDSAHLGTRSAPSAGRGSFSQPRGTRPGKPSRRGGR